MKSILFTLAAIVLVSISFGGCATIFKGTKSNVYFLNAPRDLEVWNGDERLSVERKEAPELYGFGDSFSDEVGGTRTTYYAPAVTLHSSSQYTLTLKSGSQRGEVILKPKMAMKWFWLDLFTGGILVDAITGAWNELGPEDGDINRVDVARYLK